MSNVKLTHTERVLFERFSVWLIVAPTENGMDWYYIAVWLDRDVTEFRRIVFSQAADLSHWGYIFHRGYGESPPDAIKQKYNDVIENKNLYITSGVPGDIYSIFQTWLKHERNRRHLEKE